MIFLNRSTTTYKMAAVFRFKLSDGMVEEITRFAKVHQNDGRKDYKEAWEAWCSDHSREIRAEVDRLSELGYTGDVVGKMYKAGRYYFRTKNPAATEPQERREYVSMSSSIIKTMDDHVTAAMGHDDFRPASSFADFCKTHPDQIVPEVQRLLGLGLAQEDVILKIKKTYKNRYFRCSRAH